MIEVNGAMVMFDHRSILRAHDEAISDFLQTEEGKRWAEQYAVTREDMAFAQEFYCSLSDPTPPDEDDAELPADGAAALRDVVEGEEDRDIDEAEGKDQHG